MEIGNLTLANISITAAVPIVILFLKLILDYVGMFTVERIILTNFKKFTIYLSQIIFLTIVSQFVLILFKVPLEVENDLISPILVSFIGLFIIISVAFLVIGLVATGLSIKIHFYIMDNNKSEKWFIKRMVGNNKLLLSKSINSYKFVDLEFMNDKEIFRTYKVKKTIWGQDFFSEHMKIVQIVLAILIIVTSLITWGVAEKGNIYEVIFTALLLLEYFFMMYIFAASNNVKIIEEIGEVNQETSG